VDVVLGEESAEVTADGTHRLTGLPDGEVELEVGGPYLREFVPVKVRVARGRVTRHDLRLDPAGAVAVWVARPARAPKLVVVRVRGSNGVEQGFEIDEEWWQRRHGESVLLGDFGALPAGPCEVRVTWDGDERPAIAAEVKVLSRVSVRIPPP
jgi:hypothetical protein